jgi:multidrug efflux pump subunit AcrA (membrane-fusion protein)
VDAGSELFAWRPNTPFGRSHINWRISSVGAPTIGQGDIRVIVNALGTVTPIATVTVQTQLSGRLLEVGFTEGGLRGAACDLVIGPQFEVQLCN